MQDSQPHVLMAAAECRDLAKVGGLADVVRDLSAALAQLGVPVGIIMPCYDGIQHPAEPFERFTVRFGMRDDWPVAVFTRELDGVTVYLLASRDFFGGEYGQVYVDSDRLGRGPFEDDAQRFAFFSAAALEFIARHPELALDALHCHDWHTGVMLVLLKHDPRYRQLAGSLQTLFTIHNLDYQGVRPLELEDDRRFFSFAQWFPELYHSMRRARTLAPILDPHAPIPCFNPMRAGINLAANVNTVSPTYEKEITLPDDPSRNFIGGRGLERDLRALGPRLHGILNGLNYQLNDPSKLAPPFDADLPAWQSARRQHTDDFVENLPGLIRELAARSGRTFKNAESVLNKMAAYQRSEWREKPLVVAVTRVVSQKVSILLEPVAGSVPLFRRILDRDLSLILFGTGELEAEFEELNRSENGLFICAFDPQFASLLYAGGDLFLMPSDFEPCGISQMIAMRYGCLPLVADVGGLADTVQDMETGFVYGGDDRPAARRALLSTLDRALDCYLNKSKWTDMQVQAMRARFEWSASAKQYVELYRK